MTAIANWTANYTGIYYVEAREFFGDSGNYRLTALGADTIETNATTSALATPGTRTSRIDAYGDGDWFRLDAVAGVTYTATLSRTGQPDQLDDIGLFLRNNVGTELSRQANFDTNSVTIQFQATYTGAYFWEVREWGEDQIGSYFITFSSTQANFSGGAGADNLTANDQDNRIVALAGNDRVSALGGDDFVKGNAGADSLRGGDDNDRLYGDEDNDRIYGDAGNDQAYGGTGNDFLFGGDGVDRLKGDGGSDRHTGGLARDYFVFGTGAGRDTVLDFQDRIDRIRIESGANDFGDLRIREVRGDTFVTFAGVTIVLDGIDSAQVSAADFLFA